VGSSSDGVAVLAVDILPTALPRDATTHFGDSLLPILQQLLFGNKDGGGGSGGGGLLVLPEVLRAAAITHEGSLTERFQYITGYRQEREKVEEALKGRKTTKTASSSSLSAPADAAVAVDASAPGAVVLVQGHLFDSKFINTGEQGEQQGNKQREGTNKKVKRAS